MSKHLVNMDLARAPASKSRKIIYQMGFDLQSPACASTEAVANTTRGQLGYDRIVFAARISHTR